MFRELKTETDSVIKLARELITYLGGLLLINMLPEKISRDIQLLLKTYLNVSLVLIKMCINDQWTPSRNRDPVNKRGGGWDLINPATFGTSTWISNVICCCLFFVFN